jgi:hypothetical protein
MKLDPDFIHHRKIKRDPDCCKLFARRAGSSRSHDVIVAATLLALLVVATAPPSLIPASARRSGLAGPALDLVSAEPVRAQQHDLGSPDLLLSGIAIPHKCLQPEAIRRANSDGNADAHAPDSHAIDFNGIPSGIQMSDLIH